MSKQCSALSTPDTQWNFCPNIGASYFFTILFVMTAIAHFIQTIYHKKLYCWVITISAVAQTLTYVFRDLSILHPASEGAYTAWFVIILIAPLFTNAFVYMVMGRMVWNYTAEAKLYKIPAWRFGAYFVILDIVAFIVQVYGAASASGSDKTNAEALKGIHIYMAGVAIQQVFIFVFLFFAIKFHRTLLRESHQLNKSPTQPLQLLYTIYVVLALITIRIIFRLAEYSQGLKSSAPNHEAFQYCLDSLPMLIALVMLNVVHPGRIMPGKESNIPGRKERKAGLTSKKFSTEQRDTLELVDRSQRTWV